MKICKTILYIFFAILAILFFILLDQCIKIAGYDAQLHDHYSCYEKYMWILVGIFILGGLSALLFFRPKCKRKALRVLRYIFAVILLLTALTVAGDLTADEYQYDDVGWHEKSLEQQEIVQSIIDDLQSHDTTLIDSIIHDIYYHSAEYVAEQRDHSISVRGLSFSQESAIEDAYNEAWHKRAEEGNGFAEWIKGDKEINRQRELDWGDESYYEDKKRNNSLAEHAFYWWSRSASHGYGFAYIRMAECYEGIIKIPTLHTNRQIAFEWWQKAALAGYASGYYSMGRMLAEDNKIDEAFVYWQIADSMGSEKAREALTKVYANGVQQGAIKDNPL